MLFLELLIRPAVVAEVRVGDIWPEAVGERLPFEFYGDINAGERCMTVLAFFSIESAVYNGVITEILVPVRV